MTRATGHAVGEVLSAHLDVHWNHDWIADGGFDDIRHAILYDYAVHYFDLVACVMADRELRQGRPDNSIES